MRTSVRNRIRGRRYEHRQFVALVRRQVERSYYFMLCGMSLLLLMASCTQRLYELRNREYAAPTVAHFPSHLSPAKP